MKFVHLHTHSHYSLLDGLAKIDDLVKRAKELGMKALAITDHGNLYGAIEFYKKAQKAELKPILGVEAYIAPNGRLNKRARIDDEYHHLILLVENETGWHNLIRLVTKANLEGFYYKPRMDKELLREYHDGLIATSACLGGEVSQFLLHDQIEEAEKLAREYKEIFGPENFFLEIGHHPHIKELEKVNPRLIELSKKLDIPLVATHDIHYVLKEDAEYHDILLAVQTGNKLTDDDRLTLKIDDFSMKSPEEMIEAFKDVPGAVENSVKIAERCNVALTLGKTILPNFPLEEGKTADSYLHELIKERTAKRFPETNDKIKERLEYELGVIEKTGFADYFLIVQDFVNWAKEHGIVVGPGRGSAAGSLVSYILGITNIDPLKYDLLFERFLNPERISMPDIDLDFADKRRDEVLAYVRQKYGEDRVAQIITFGTMAARAAVRDAGRALGLSYSFCDVIAKLIPFHPNTEKISHLRNDIELIPELKEKYKNDQDAKTLLNAAMKLEGVARHASVHACGVVISKDPLIEHVPLQYAPQDQSIIITQFEMHAIEDLGLLKIDFLGLKNLTIIEEAKQLIKEIEGKEIDIEGLPLDDKETFKLLRDGDTTGIFQLESSGMRRYLKELKPTELEDIIAMVSLYRPGPMELIPSFVKRKHGKEKVQYMHPKLEPILKNTYGIGIYQEQMMRIARDLAGFTLGEADTLRKAIGKKIKSLLDDQREKLISGMIKNGISEKTAVAIWDLFPPFARYGFNRSHAACYALIGYQTAYLKAHYPVEFTTSLLNADSGDVDRIAFFVSEAKKGGIEIFPPDINKSFANFMPDDKNIRFGLLAIKNVGEGIVNAVIEERQRGGPFQNFTECLTRIKHKDLNKKSLENMAKAGVFDSLRIERNTVISNMDDILSFVGNLRKSETTSQSNLFGSGYISNLNLKPAAPASNKEKLIWEKELLGLYISDHPLKEHIKRLRDNGIKSIKDLTANGNNGNGNPKPVSYGPYFNNNGNTRIAGVISGIKKIITKNGKQIIFAKLEDLSDTLEVIVFADTISKNPSLWKENNVILVQGHLSPRNGEPKFVCNGAIEL